MDNSNIMEIHIARKDKLNQTIVFSDSKEEAQYTYPSDYWKTSKNQPPSISIMDVTSSQIYSLLMEDLAVSQWRDPVISTFIYCVVQEHPEIFEVTLDKDWTPKNEPAIGKKTEKINPFSLIRVTKDYPTTAAKTELPDSKKSRLSLLLCVLITYRKIVMKTNNPNQHNEGFWSTAGVQNKDKFLLYDSKAAEDTGPRVILLEVNGFCS
ncbi:hypothetical protein JTE90_010157 [Oedothorax gibbosus]|uniref:Rhabdovirus nucleocapsid domain-containing protein n=1 Tax=Oedothorax gibbosus TaxID=931172 RepID=A0AAV6TW83_9ARAC|nr:hypothetical protein JTE90_010157 [Oedothorax gibbosus]